MTVQYTQKPARDKMVVVGTHSGGLTARGRLPTRRRSVLTRRQVNLVLETLVTVAIVTGVASWIAPIEHARIFTYAHAVAGFGIVLVGPLKLRGPVRSGFRRRRAGRWVSASFGTIVLATIGLGVAHSTGAWFGVGPWSALWTHQLLGFAGFGLLLWHAAVRPVRPRVTDLDRRAFLSTAIGTTTAVGIVVVQEWALDAAGLAGGRRDGTGSHEAGSFDPAAMPTVQWLDDTAPTDTSPDEWPLTVVGRPVGIGQLTSQTEPLVARLDCTGGWFADQRWDVVPVAALLPTGVGGRSLRVTSATGYRRLYPLKAAGDLYLATGYGGRPLRRGHGAPVRLVAPGRRGPQWVKWVTEIDITDRPSWLQLPLPPT